MFDISTFSVRTCLGVAGVTGDCFAGECVRMKGSSSGSRSGLTLSVGDTGVVTCRLKKPKISTPLVLILSQPWRTRLRPVDPPCENRKSDTAALNALIHDEVLECNISETVPVKWRKMVAARQF